MDEKFIFFPSSAIEATPKDYGVDYEDIYFTTADGVKLNGWLVSYPGAKTTLLWFHGNGGNIGHRARGAQMLHDKVRANVFMIDYRGYGRSEGVVSEKGTYEDADAAFSYLMRRSDIDPKRIVLFGQSLGSAVAAELAGRQECLAVILEAPFASIPAMAKAIYPWLPVGALITTRYDVIEKVKKIRAPLLVVHGDRDDIVPFEQGKRVFDAATGPKEFHALRGAHHNDTFEVGGDAYFAVMKDFTERAAKAR
ncbi:MAG TPA: alpha/beta hydrolase [Candidatus Binatia bacterium]|nr:alpha/beta hydrolase [Candidatus Binatia bacterium]